LRTRAIPERHRGVFTTRYYTNPRLPLPYLTLPYLTSWHKSGEFQWTTESSLAASSCRRSDDHISWACYI